MTIVSIFDVLVTGNLINLMLVMSLLTYELINSKIDQNDSMSKQSEALNSLIQDNKELKTHIASIKLKLGFKPNKE